LANALSGQHIKTPTPIQAEAIPEILRGGDFVLSSPTGTGKTLAYLLPAFAKLSDDTELVKKVQVLILLPTYELAAQVWNVASALWREAGVGGAEPVLVIGNAGIGRQIEALKKKPRVVIGSPGRVCELIKLKKLVTHFVHTLVLDEGDRLADKTTLEHLTEIVKTIPRKSRQTLLFSATAKITAERFHDFFDNPRFISIGGTKRTEIPRGIHHIAVSCERRDKLKAIRGYIHGNKVEKALLFVRNAEEAQRMAERLSFHGIATLAISSNHTGPQRKTAINKLREGGVTLLVATDAASRGLDIPALTHVFHMEPPFTAEEYLHRAGRVGRMGNSGESVVFVSGKELERLLMIGKTLDIRVEV